MRNARSVGHILGLLLALAPSAAGANGLPPAVARVQAALDAWDLSTAERLASELAGPVCELATTTCVLAAVDLAAGRALAAHARLAAPPPDHGPGKSASDACPELAERVAAAALLAHNSAPLATPHFVVRGAGKDEIVSTYAGPVLEAAWAALGRHLHFAELAAATPKVNVEIYPDRESLARASGLGIAAIETSGTVAVAKEHRLLVLTPLAYAHGYNWQDTLAHELTHFVVGRLSRGKAPVWLQEGLAKVYESSWRRPPGAHHDHDTVRRLRAAARRDELIALRALHPSIALLPSRQATALAFAEVASLVDAARQAGGDQALANMLIRLGKGQPLERAWAPPLPPLAAHEAAWRRRLARARPLAPALAEAADDGEPGDDAAPPSLSEAPLGAQVVGGERAAKARRLRRLGELLLLDGDAAAAAKLYEQALATVREPEALRRLGVVRIELGAPKEARALLTEAIRKNGSKPDGRLELAGLLLAAGDLAAARTELLALCGFNPFVPAAHAALATIAARVGDQEAAARERRFVALTQAPRSPLAPLPAILPAPARAGAAGCGQQMLKPTTGP